MLDSFAIAELTSEDYSDLGHFLKPDFFEGFLSSHFAFFGFQHSAWNLEKNFDCCYGSSCCDDFVPSHGFLSISDFDYYYAVSDLVHPGDRNSDSFS
jgi:hypothetical protein